MPKKIRTSKARYGTGSIKTLGEDRYELRYYTGTAEGRRVRKYKTFHGTYQQAIKTLKACTRAAEDPDFIIDAPITFGRWLNEWLESVAKGKAVRTYETYRQAADNHIIPILGHHALGKLRTTHLRAYFNELPNLSVAAKQTHYVVIHSALKAAVLEGLVKDNAASRLQGKPQVNKGHTSEDVLTHCWIAEEARQFLNAAILTGPRQAAFYSLALDSGMRKGELCGLKWQDVDWNAGTIRIERSLIRIAVGGAPIFGPGKGGRARTIMVTRSTLEMLRVYEIAQVRYRLTNGQAYIDYGLIFTREGEMPGAPLLLNNIGNREYAAIIRLAGVRPIKFHGLRHTCATLLLEAGVPIHQVAARLGHKDTLTTLREYAHAIPSGEAKLVANLDKALGFVQEPGQSTWKN